MIKRKLASGIRRRSLLAGVAALGATGAMGAATGCSRVDVSGATGGGHLLEDLRKKGTVRMGIASEPPYASINSKGELTGEAPAVAKTIFRRLGVKNFEPVPVEFQALVPGLHSFQYDVIVAGMFINKARCAAVLFSDPDYESKDAFLVRKETRTRSTPMRISPGGNTGWVPVSAMRRSTTRSAMASRRTRSRPTVTRSPEWRPWKRAVSMSSCGTALTMIEALKTGGHPKVEMTSPFTPVVDGKPQRDGGGYGFRLGETKLRDAFNNELQKMKKSGELLRIAKPYGFTKEFMTDLTAKELCKK